MNPSGNPVFGPQANTGFLWLYENTNTGDTSLGMIFNEDGYGGYGRTDIYVSGLPQDAYFDVRDDDSDIYQTFSVIDGAWFFRLTWRDNTDGSVIGLVGPWDEITMTLDNARGISSWYFLSGDSINPESVTLDMSHSVSISPVPESSTLALLAIGLVGLIGYEWRRRHH